MDLCWKISFKEDESFDKYLIVVQAPDGIALDPWRFNHGQDIFSRDRIDFLKQGTTLLFSIGFYSRCQINAQFLITEATEYLIQFLFTVVETNSTVDSYYGTHENFNYNSNETFYIRLRTNDVATEKGFKFILLPEPKGNVDFWCCLPFHYRST